MAKSVCAALILVSFFYCVVAECPTYYTEFNSKCYRVFGAKKTWSDASSYCRLDGGGNLVSIHSSSENDFVFDFWRTSTGGNDGYYWIGMNDIDNEAWYKWSDGSSVVYQNFYMGEPNNNGNEDCVHVYPSVKQWNDWKCSQELSFVCKRDTI
ncbi:alpha-N-acetylgalactosamine-specific lectin-like [Diadema antillarum]|uniref:alpha-N-acetylgalactosamine-specific lectin-like n=1 Tax=Diadema antillarum TaxID=105358 RepID=UPI003A86A482